MFNIGDRVRFVGTSANPIRPGSTGTVVDFGLDSVKDGVIMRRTTVEERAVYGVEWDEDVGGHDCDGNAKQGYGWRVRGIYLDYEDDGLFEYDDAAFVEMLSEAASI